VTAELAAEVAIACRLVHEAAAVLEHYFESGELAAQDKGFLDIVTRADRESEQLIVNSLREGCPDDGIVGEEGTGHRTEASRVWYIDPLDGTFNFARGLPFWCLSVGLAIDSEPTLGVIFDPIHDDLFVAVRGQGATLNGQAIATSSPPDLRHAAIQCSISVEDPTVEFSLADTVALGHSVMRVRNLGAVALELCYVACGRLDGLVQRTSHPWDYAAAAIIVLESGGELCGIDGTSWSLDRPDLVAAADSPTRDALLRAVNGRV
jgi:myo-inositol-1(or 4)-monophosphatase